MSEFDRAGNGGPSEVLEHNVEQLLGRAHEPPQMSTEARQRVLVALRSRARTRRAEAEASPRPRLGRRAWTAAGATLAAGIAAAMIAASLGGGSGFAPTTYESGAAVRSIELADGTTLVLNREARAVLVGPRHLRVERGDLLLDVARGDEPFVVNAPHGRAVVLGTRFVLSADAGETRAAVVRGKVRLENDRGTEVLGVGEAGVLRAERAPTRHPAPRLSHLTGWARAATRETDAQTVQPTRRGVLLARNPQWQEREFPLPVRELTVDVRVENQVARVAIDQTFFNAQDQILEGVYHIVLPPDAAISRQAMYVDGTLMESAVVERQQARRIYEEIVYRRRDPALLEWMSGNIYKVRIFPLPARAEKRIAFEYTQTLARLYDDYRLEVPLPEIDAPVGTLRLRARLVGCGACQVASPSHEIASAREGEDLLVSYEAANHQVGDDLVLSVRDPSSGVRVARAPDGDHEYLMVRVQPQIGAAARERATRRWVILHDTSASRGPAERKAQAYLIDRFLREVDEYDEVAVLAFDTMVRTFGAGFERVDQIDRAAVARFVSEQARDGVGQTDLGTALTRALELVDRDGGDGEPYLLYLGDGIVTGGEQALATLRATLSGQATFVGVAVGERMDDRVLRGLAAATGGIVSHMNPGDDLAWRAYDLVAALETPRVVGLEASLHAAGDTQVAGEEVLVSAAQLADGEELTVVARLGGVRPTAVELRGTVHGAPWSARLELPAAGERARERDAGYLPREWARRRIASLLDGEAEETRAEIVALGMEHFLVTPYTSLLVLENDAMYEHYKVSRDRAPRWAEYALPATIEVVVEPGPRAAHPGVSLDAFMARTPLQLFVGSNMGYGGARISAGLGGERGELGDFGGAVVTLSTMPVGGASGTGTGAGFGATAEPMVDSTVALAGNDLRQTITTEELGKVGDTWSVREREKSIARGHRGRGPGRFQTQQVRARDAGAFGWDGNGRGGFFYDSHHAGNGLQPIALTQATDARLDDLTILVPALLDDAFDAETRIARARRPSRAGTITDEARNLIRDARRQRASGRFEGSDGSVLTVDDAGAFRLERVLDSGLREVVLYDGSTLEHRYSELALGTRRDVRELEAQVLARYLPFVVATPEALARWFDISLTSGGALELRRIGADKLAGGVLEMKLDDRSRVIQLRTVSGGVARVLLDIEYRGDVMVIGDVSYMVDPLGWDRLADRTGDELMVEMPLRQPAYWLAEMSGQATPSRPTRQTQQQLLASWAALGNEAELWKLAQEMGAAQGLDRGELVLASRGLRSGKRAALDALTRGVAKDDAIGQYLRASRRYADDPRRAGAFDELAASQAGTFIGALAGYRVVLSTLWSQNAREHAARRAEALARTSTSPMLSYLAAHAFASRFGWQAPRETARLWDEVAERASSSQWRHHAAGQAARALYNGRQYDRAAARYEALLAAQPASGSMPVLDRTAQWAFRQSARGEAGWKLFWARWREACESRGDLRSMVSLMQSATMLGEQRDVDRAATRLVSMDLGDGMLAAEVARTLHTSGRTESALAVLLPHVRGPDAAPELLALASVISEQQGQLAAAAAYLERAIAAEADYELSLDQLRQDSQRMLLLYARLIDTAGEAGRAARVDRALTLVADWRAIDPDNSQIDTLAAQVLFAAGEHEQARRYLSTAIELHPGEGSAYEVVASALEAEGRVAEAEPLWRRAFEVEPTNPTWLMRHANALYSLGRPAEARVLLEQIIAGTWHERFSGFQYQARRLLDQVD
ncbi:MAG TPA: VIT domain-containing protein [Kofleriaceae bacterium]|nr:VIT domain-containing protein [Kofleriaceae bacterium]